MPAPATAAVGQARTTTTATTPLPRRRCRSAPLSAASWEELPSSSPSRFCSSYAVVENAHLSHHLPRCPSHQPHRLVPRRCRTRRTRRRVTQPRRQRPSHPHRLLPAWPVVPADADTACIHTISRFSAAIRIQRVYRPLIRSTGWDDDDCRRHILRCNPDPSPVTAAETDVQSVGEPYERRVVGPAAQYSCSGAQHRAELDSSAESCANTGTSTRSAPTPGVFPATNPLKGVPPLVVQNATVPPTAAATSAPELSLNQLKPAQLTTVRGLETRGVPREAIADVVAHMITENATRGPGEVPPPMYDFKERPPA